MGRLFFAPQPNSAGYIRLVGLLRSIRFTVPRLGIAIYKSSLGRRSHSEKYPLVMKQVWAAMDATATNWRKVFKSLNLVEHLVKNGNERVVEDARDHMFKIRTLTDFNFYEGAIDRGNGGKFRIGGQSNRPDAAFRCMCLFSSPAGSARESTKCDRIAPG